MQNIYSYSLLLCIVLHNIPVPREMLIQLHSFILKLRRDAAKAYYFASLSETGENEKKCPRSEQMGGGGGNGNEIVSWACNVQSV
jgi:hypothetical protein